MHSFQQDRKSKLSSRSFLWSLINPNYSTKGYSGNCENRRYGKKFQVEKSDSQQTVLSEINIWTTLIEHKGWAVYLIVNVCSGENEKCTRITADVELLCIVFYILWEEYKIFQHITRSTNWQGLAVYKHNGMWLRYTVWSMWKQEFVVNWNNCN